MRLCNCRSRITHECQKTFRKAAGLFFFFPKQWHIADNFKKKNLNWKSISLNGCITLAWYRQLSKPLLTLGFLGGSNLYLIPDLCQEKSNLLYRWCCIYSPFYTISLPFWKVEKNCNGAQYVLSITQLSNDRAERKSGLCTWPMFFSLSYGFCFLVWIMLECMHLSFFNLRL